MDMLCTVGWGKPFEQACFLQTSGCEGMAGYLLRGEGLPDLYCCSRHLGKAMQVREQQGEMARGMCDASSD